MPAPVQQNFGPQLAGILYSLTGLSTSQGSTTAYTCTSAGVYEFNATVVTTTRYLQIADPERARAMKRHPLNDYLGLATSQERSSL